MYLGHVLGPALVPGGVVVPGNLRVRTAAGLLFLPPCPPGFTPVEPAFSKLKSCLRTAPAKA